MGSMKAKEVAALIGLLEENGLEVYVDGGWAVDALLGEQTREHKDLDIALPHKQVSILREALSNRGYREQPSNDSWECNFVLGDGQGREIDVHSYTLDDDGNHVSGVAYSRKHFAGTGLIDGQPVRCISPEWLVQFHSGYELDENDYRDVKALCDRFGIALPDEYRRFTT
jgi:lincosamide nucleotidyltransferase A/C/D/E